MIAMSRVRVLLLGTAFTMGLGSAVQAHPHHGYQGRHISTGRHGARTIFRSSGLYRSAVRQVGYGAGRHTGWLHHSYALGSNGRRGLQCVAFARADSGIEIIGNASAWWDHAAGIYARGARPEPGAVLNFRANWVMRLGHVAVVKQVVDSRTIEIDHANWNVPGGISRDISVVDVSLRNDWSAVRVAVNHSGDYGSIYPTYGFIYNRSDDGTMVVSNDVAKPVPALNPAPRDLRAPVLDKLGDDEVAEAPDDAGLSGDQRPVNHYGRYRVRYLQPTVPSGYLQPTVPSGRVHGPA